VAFIGMSIGILFLIWLIIGITKNTQIPQIQIKGPALELAFGLLILIIWSFAPLRYFYLSMVDGITHLILVVWHSASLPNLAFGDKWSLGFILKRNLILFVLPFVFLKARKNSLSSMGLTTTDWKKNLRTGLIVFLAMAIPSAFYGNTASSILSGKLSLVQVSLGFPASFTFSLFMSGFSEEFLFRAFIQTRFSTVLKSKVGGILITALLFGLIHISSIMRWYPGTTLFQAFCRAFFVQTFLGLILGVLWERTRNLIPCAFLHSGINGLNGLVSIISRLGL